MSKYADIKPEDIPEWATPEAWAETEHLVNTAARYFLNKIAEELPSEAYGKFIVLDADSPADHRISDDEPKAKEKFWKAFGKNRRAVVLQIGYVVAS
jgi:hypothetical protein